MTNLKFNIYGFTKPANKAEYIALLEEASRIQDELSSQIDHMQDSLEEQAKLALA